MAAPPTLYFEAPLAIDTVPLISVSVSYGYEPVDLVQFNYLSGHGEPGERGAFITQFRSVRGPGADYFDPMGVTEGMMVQWFWTDLVSFFWWEPIRELGAGGVLSFTNYFPPAERIVVQPSVIDADLVPDPVYEVDDD